MEDCVTSPVRNLQKKTDLFQLQKVFMKSFVISVLRSTTLLKVCNALMNSRVINGLFRYTLQTLLEMNEFRRAKKLSPFEVLRNEALEFIDSLVKYDILSCCSD